MSCRLIRLKRAKDKRLQAAGELGTAPCLFRVEDRVVDFAWFIFSVDFAQPLSYSSSPKTVLIQPLEPFFLRITSTIDTTEQEVALYQQQSSSFR